MLMSCMPNCDEAYPASMDLDSVNDQNQVLDGLDVVACYNKTEVGIGKDNIVSVDNGVKFNFLNSQNKTMFDSNPKKFMPQVGGYCIVAAAYGKVEAVDKKHYGVYNGKLYFTTNEKAFNMWMKNQEELTQKGEAMWPCLVSKKGRKI